MPKSQLPNSREMRRGAAGRISVAARLNEREYRSAGRRSRQTAGGTGLAFELVIVDTVNGFDAVAWRRWAGGLGRCGDEADATERERSVGGVPPVPRGAADCDTGR